LGLQLVDVANKPYDARQLAPSDVVVLYFSAHWCPPCRQFTPNLKKFVETLQSTGDQSMKVIFVSRDQSEMDMWKYIHESHGNWLAVNYAGNGRDQLCQRYGVSGIPALVVLNQVGQPAVPMQNCVGAVMSSVQSATTNVLKTFFDWRTASGALAAPAADRCDLLPKGTRVGVRGLSGAAELNGSEGEITSFDGSKQRYTVQIGERCVALRAANLLQLAPVRLRVAEGVWEDARIADVDDATRELVVRRAGEAAEPERMSLQSSDSLRLMPGTRVVVQELSSEAAKRWNEHLGAVVEYDEDAGRYLVEVAHETRLKIRSQNMRLCPLC